jgi:hypothetical protein
LNDRAATAIFINWGDLAVVLLYKERFWRLIPANGR